MQEIWNKLVRFCNYQERCRHDVLKKLKALEVGSSDYTKWIKKLEEENLLNELRFVTLFVSGRFKNKKWGRRKIEMELKKRNIDVAAYANILAELLPTEDYEHQLQELAHRKWKSIKGATMQNRKQKLFRFLAGKGFESEQISKVVKRME